MTEVKSDVSGISEAEAVERIADDLGYFAIFRVGLPSDLQSVENDVARAEISREILIVLEKMSLKYGGLTLDYNFGYELRKQIPIPLIED